METAIDIDPFQTAADFDRAHGQLLEGLTARGQRLDESLLREIEAFAARGSAGGAYLLDPAERRSCQAMLDFWATQAYGANRKVRARLAKPDPSLLPQLEDSKCPYVGLRSFGEGDSKLYFGREDEVRKLAARLERERLVVVAGVSGSGKSSLVLAGLIPALKQGALEGSKGWHYPPPVLPGRDPLRALAASVAPATGEALDETVEELRDDPDYLTSLLARSGQPAVLVIDQFEEVFTLRKPETDADYDAFVEHLLKAAQAEGQRHRVVLTMRSEFQSKLVRYLVLHERYTEISFPVSEMAQTALRAAIEQPAATIGLKFQPGVVDGIVKSMVGEENNPPLLQFALTQLWKERVGNLITEEALRRLGNVKQTIANVAQAIWQDRLAPQQQTASDAVFLRLAREGDGPLLYRDRVSRAELRTLAEEVDVDFVLKTFTEAHLLRVTPTDPARRGEDLIEVVHESLLRNWPRIGQLIAARNAERGQRAFLKNLAEQWRNMKYARGYLLSGFALKEANEKFGSSQDLNEAERQFLAESTKLENARTTEMTAKLALAIATAVTFAVVAMNSCEKSRDLEDKNREFLSREAAGAALKVAQRDPILGVLVAQAAFDTKPTAQALGALYSSMWLSQLRPSMSLPPAQAGRIEVMALSADGLRLLTVGDRKVREWRLDQNPPAPAATLEGIDGGAVAVEGSPDGKRIAAIARKDRRTHLYYWDLATAPTSPRIIEFRPATADARLAFSADGNLLAAFAGDSSGKLSLWKLQPFEQKPQELQLPGTPVAMNFGNTSDHLTVLLGNGQLLLGKLGQDGRMGALAPMGKRCEETSAPQYTLSRRSFVAIAPQHICHNQFALDQKFEMDDHVGQLGQVVKLSPDGEFAAVPQRWTRSIMVFGTDSGFERRLPGAFDIPEMKYMDRGDISRVTNFIQLSDPPRRLTARRTDGSISIYDLEQPPLWPSAKGDAEFAPGGLRYASVTRPPRESAKGSMLEVREWPGNKPLGKPLPADGMTLDKFTGDGRYVAASGGGQAVVLDLANNGAPLTAPANGVVVGRKHVVLLRHDESQVFLRLVNGEERKFASPVVADNAELVADQITGDSGTTFVLFRIANGRFSPFRKIEVPDKRARAGFEATGRYFLVETMTAAKESSTQLWALEESAVAPKHTIAGSLVQAVADPEGTRMLGFRRSAPGRRSPPGLVLDLKTGKVAEIERVHRVSPAGRHLTRSAEGSEGFEVLEVLAADSSKRKLWISGQPQLEFSPNGSLLVAAYPDGNSLTLYNVEQERAVAEISIDGISEAGFDATGINMVVTSNSGKELIPVNVTVLRGIVDKLAGTRKLNNTERCEHLRDEDACGRARR